MEIERLARIALSRSAEPADQATAALVRQVGAVAALGATEVVLARAAEDLTRWRTAGIETLIPGDAGWPTQLDDLEAPPLMLWVRGKPLRVSLLRSLTVVGARAATGPGREIAVQWSASLASDDYTIVSGGAFGIDAAAHRGALQCRGRTVAVLAGGVDVASPRSHAELLDRVVEHGTVVSEVPPGTSPARHRFLTRNRLIAALTPATLVVQAAQRSGALATARRAAELGRIVMAVPGPVDDPVHAGCHSLIRDHVAVLVSGPDEVRELLEPIGGQSTGSSTAR